MPPAARADANNLFALSPRLHRGRQDGARLAGFPITFKPQVSAYGEEASPYAAGSAGMLPAAYCLPPPYLTTMPPPLTL